MLTIKEIFNECRTCYKFSSKKVDENILREMYDLIKLGPTSANSSPLRIIFIESYKQKEEVLSCLMEGNIEKSRSAPVIALLAYDTKFYTHMSHLFPPNPNFGKMFESNEALAEETAFRNSSLQAAYLIIAARAVGLDVGPMSGFDTEKLNDKFFANSTFKVNLICNLGYKDDQEPYPRLPRFTFDEACKII